MHENSSDTLTEVSGIEAVKRALQDSTPRRSLSWLSRELGLSRGATAHWDKVPEDHIARVSELTGLHPRVIRPDLAELFTESV